MKQAKANKGGPSSSSGPKTQKKVVLKKSEKKKKTVHETQKEKEAKAANEPVPGEAEKKKEKFHNQDQLLGNSKKGKNYRKWTGSSIKPEDIIDTLPTRTSAPAKWENLSDEVLKRGPQKVENNFRGRIQPTGEKNEQINSPTGATDDSSMEDIPENNEHRTSAFR